MLLLFQLGIGLHASIPAHKNLGFDRFRRSHLFTIQNVNGNNFNKQSNENWLTASGDVSVKHKVYGLSLFEDVFITNTTHVSIAISAQQIVDKPDDQSGLR